VENLKISLFFFVLHERISGQATARSKALKVILLQQSVLSLIQSLFREIQTRFFKENEKEREDGAGEIVT
jgi:hypothetical protein